MTYDFSPGAIKAGKVFLHEGSWIVSAPASGRRTAFLAYATREDAEAAHTVFSTPLTADQISTLQSQRKFLRDEAERRAKAEEARLAAASRPLRPSLTQDYARSLFDYREDGKLVWKVAKSARIKAGTVAGHKTRLAIDLIAYDPRAIIWLWHHGSLPRKVVSLDRNRANTRIENLATV